MLRLRQILYVRSYPVMGDSDALLMIVGCYPFQEKDQFVIEECPHVYFAGNQPNFETSIIEGPEGQWVRLIAVPKFKETGELVLLDVDTMEIETVKFDIFNES